MERRFFKKILVERRSFILPGGISGTIETALRCDCGGIVVEMPRGSYMNPICSICGKKGEDLSFNYGYKYVGIYNICG